METAAYIIVVALFVLGACLVIYGTIVKNRWGVNFRRLSCPNCGTQMAQVRAQLDRPRPVGRLHVSEVRMPDGQMGPTACGLMPRHCLLRGPFLCSAIASGLSEFPLWSRAFSLTSRRSHVPILHTSRERSTRMFAPFCLRTGRLRKIRSGASDIRRA